MGKVFLAKDLKTGKKVAVKILKDENQWKREKEILNQLKNIKGIPKLFLAENTKDHFLVMEYIKGQSLKTYKTVHGKISEKTLILLMYKVCKVLEQKKYLYFENHFPCFLYKLYFQVFSVFLL